MITNGQMPAAADIPLADKLAQLITVRIGSNLAPVRTVEQDEQRLAELVAACPVGGLVLFNGRHGDTTETLARLQKISRYPLLVGSDIERGYGQQLRLYPLFPHAMAFDALGDEAPDAVRRFGELTAHAARRAGVHVDFAPVADVNTEPRNPIIATRAFSTEPARAAELAAAFVKGCRAGGLLTAAKHFPGHGDTHQDSHHELPTAARPAEAMHACELEPFRATIAAGVPVIMTAHVCYPGLDPSGACATLSRPILMDLLRDELGFEGVIVSDSLLMSGVREQAATEGELCVRALNAGIDLLLDVEHPQAAVEALAAAVSRGELALDRVDDAYARLTRLKRAMFSPAPNDLVAAVAPETYSQDELHRATEQLAADVAAAAVRVASPEPLPGLTPATKLLAVLVNPYRSHLDEETPSLFAELHTHAPEVKCVEVRGEEPAEIWQSLAVQAQQYDEVLVAIVVKPAAWQHFGLPAPAADWVGTLIAQREVILACLGTPVGLQPFSAARHRLCTYSDVPASQRALVRRLYGRDEGPRTAPA